MNRQIQFRGKTADNRWVEGSLVTFAGDYWIVHAEPTRYGEPKWMWDKVDRNSIGQYITTIHLTVIYEGDIILLTDLEYGEEFRAEVVLDYMGPHLVDIDGFSVFTRTYRNTASTRDSIAKLYDILEHENHKFKIIGNIHDNPELLDVDPQEV